MKKSLHNKLAKTAKDLYKIADVSIADVPNLDISKTNEPIKQYSEEGIPFIDKRIGRASIANTSAGIGGHLFELPVSHPQIFNAVDRAAHSLSALHPLLNTANNKVRNVLKPISPFMKGVGRVAGIASPILDTLSATNRYTKGETLGGNLDALSAAAGAGALAFPPAAPVLIPISLAATAGNIYRDETPLKSRNETRAPFQSQGMITGGASNSAEFSPEQLNNNKNTTPPGKPLTNVPSRIGLEPPQKLPTGSQLISGGVERSVPIPRVKLNPKLGEYSENAQKAFIAGIYKRAKETGLDKEAFLAPLLAGALDLGSSLGTAHLLTKGLGRLAAMKNLGSVGKGIKKFYNYTQSPGTTLGPLVGNLVVMNAADAVSSPIVRPIKRFLGLEQQQPQQ